MQVIGVLDAVVVKGLPSIALIPQLLFLRGGQLLGGHLAGMLTDLSAAEHACSEEQETGKSPRKTQ